MKDENLQLSLQLHETRTQLQNIKITLSDLELKYQEADNQRKERRERLEAVEKRLYEAKTHLRESELLNAKLTLENKSLKEDLSKSLKEVAELKDKITRLSDPVVTRFERDGLVQTHQKRIKELENINSSLE